VFTKDNAAEMGQKGGQVRSFRKLRAARKNSQKGGRKRIRTLAELLLRRRIPLCHQQYISTAFNSISVSDRERRLLWSQFGTGDIMNETCDPSRIKRPPKSIKNFFEMFKLRARQLLEDAPAPKEYVMEYSRRSYEEEKGREQEHPYLPWPPRRVRIYIRKLPGFCFIEQAYAKDPNLTVKDVQEVGGSRWTQKRAECALDLLHIDAENRAAVLAEAIAVHSTAQSEQHSISDWSAIEKRKKKELRKLFDDFARSEVQPQPYVYQPRTKEQWEAVMNQTGDSREEEEQIPKPFVLERILEEEEAEGIPSRSENKFQYRQRTAEQLEARINQTGDV
jgi:hypothetical protein